MSNLPFAGSGAILAHLLRDPRVDLRRADVIVQWELASKHSAAWPSTLRGSYWNAWFELSIVARLARSAFSPTPSADAAVLRIARRHEPLVAPDEHERYWQFLSDAFRARVPLSRALQRRLTPRELRRLAPVLGFDATSRARDLDARQWARLFVFTRRHRDLPSTPKERYFSLRASRKCRTSAG